MGIEGRWPHTRGGRRDQAESAGVVGGPGGPGVVDAARTCYAPLVRGARPGSVSRRRAVRRMASDANPTPAAGPEPAPPSRWPARVRALVTSLCVLYAAAVVGLCLLLYLASD